MRQLQNNCFRLTCKQDPSSRHTGKDPSKDRNGNSRRTGGIPTGKGDKRPNYESQNTDAQGTRLPATMCFVDFKVFNSQETCLDAFEMKGPIKILQVSWTAKKTKEWVLNKAGVKRELLDTVKLAYYGHIMEKKIMQGTMMNNIKAWTGLPVEESIRMTENGDKWRKCVHGVANPRIEDG